jgi:hypothetical protein
MAINFKTIEAGGTSTDLDVSVEGLDLILSMSYYRSGIHQLRREGEDTREIIAFDPSYGGDVRVSIYLEEDPDSDQGQFVIDIWNIGMEEPYLPEKIIMYVGEFMIPKAGITSLEDVEITALKVLGGGING